MRLLLLVFGGGWALWFLMDKQGPAYAYAARFEGGEDLIHDLQFGFDLLKSGEPGAAYAFLWFEHYFLLTIIFALMISFGLPEFRRAIGNAWRRWRSR